MERWLAYALCFVAALSFLWDLWDLIVNTGDRSVSEYVRTTWLNVPAAVAIGLLVAAHFARWPYK